MFYISEIERDNKNNFYRVWYIMDYIIEDLNYDSYRTLKLSNQKETSLSSIIFLSGYGLKYIYFLKSWLFPFSIE